MIDRPDNVNIYVLYASEDQSLAQELEGHLSSLQRLGHIDLWHEGLIEAGAEKDSVVAEYLGKADIVLLLVSANFLSPECYGRYEAELRLTYERQRRGEVRVVPVILRHCLWQMDLLAELSPLPRGGHPVRSRHWESEDLAFQEIAQELRGLAEDVRRGGAPVLPRPDTGAAAAAPVRPRRDTGAAAAAPAGKRPGLAAVLSVAPGLGQVYNRQFVKGLALFSTAVLLVEEPDFWMVAVPFWSAFDAYQVARAPERQGKTPDLAAMLGIVPGLGHFYTGDFFKGLALVAAVLLLLLFWEQGTVGWIGAFLVLLWSAYDAYGVAGGRGMRWSRPVPA